MFDQISKTGLQYLSYSSVNTYQICPELYRLKYVEKLVEEEKPIAFQFGSDVHEMLANMWNKGEKRIPDFSYMYKPDEAKKIALGLMNAGKKALFAEKSVGGWGPSVQLDLDACKDNIDLKIEYEIKTMDFKGIIDLIGWSVDGKLWVIDWKTTSQEYTPHDILSSDQLTCYAWLIKKEFGRLPDYVAFITLNKKTEKACIWASSRTEQQLLDWQRKVASVREDIKRKHFWKNPNSCVQPFGNCDYYNLCWQVKGNIQKHFSSELPRFGGGTVTNGP